MKLTKQAGEPGVTEVALEGEVRESDLPGEGNPLDALLGPGWAGGLVLLDFSKVIYMYSGGIGWLFETNRTMRTAGGKLVIHSLKAQLAQPLSFVRAERVLTIAANRDEAIKLVRTPAP